jgi:hypothetical protein
MTWRMAFSCPRQASKRWRSEETVEELDGNGSERPKPWSQPLSGTWDSAAASVQSAEITADESPGWLTLRPLAPAPVS